MAVVTQSAILCELITTAKDYKRRFPNAVGFVVAEVTDRKQFPEALDWFHAEFGEVGIRSNALTLSYSITMLMPGECIVWLRQSNRLAPRPHDALNSLASLADDVARLPGIPLPPAMIRYPGGRIEAVMRWAVDAIRAERWTWTGRHYRMRAVADATQWCTGELPCVFDAIYRALESHSAKAVGFYCDPLDTSIYFDGKPIVRGLDEDVFAYVKALADVWPACIPFREIKKTSIHLESANEGRIKDKLPRQIKPLVKGTKGKGTRLELQPAHFVQKL